jgi:hypothetical protein
MRGGALLAHDSLVANCKTEHDSDFSLHNPKLDF